MLEKNAAKLGVLRMAKTAIVNAEKESGKEVSEQDTILLVRREIKKRQDSIKAFTSAGRTELADKEKAEIEILSVYLPQALSPEELEAIVDKAITTTGAKTKKEMGQVMKLANLEAAGRVDGKTLSSLVQSKLS